MCYFEDDGGKLSDDKIFTVLINFFYYTILNLI